METNGPQEAPSSSTTPSPPSTTPSLPTLYQAICTSYNAITDWRAKLLGFLPLASGAGIFYLLNNAFTGSQTNTIITDNLLPIGLVGALVTLGLFFYDVRAIQIRHSLIEMGTALEPSLGHAGQFSHRPDSYGHGINDLVGSTLIYFAIMAGWVFLGLVFRCRQAAWWLASVVFVVGVVGVYVTNRHIVKQRQKSGARNT